MQLGQSFMIQGNENRTEILQHNTLIKLVKSLAMHYGKFFDTPPKQIIVYRDGGSEGSFQSIRNNEVEAIREAICDLNRDSEKFFCAKNCEGRNCESCAPRITCIVAQNDHNIRIVPADEKHSIKNNVPSGTLVEGHVTSFEGFDGNFDFLLTPQGGLKGTSKPMLYRVILNENSKLSPGQTELTNQKIYEMTYQMAFQYGSATKSPRKVPVLLNSEKLATRVSKYGGYLGLLEESPISLVYNEDENEVIRQDQAPGLEDAHNSLLKGRFRPHITA